MISERTAADAFAEIDRLAAQMVPTGSPSGAIELLAIDPARQVVQRRDAH